MCPSFRCHLSNGARKNATRCQQTLRLFLPNEGNNPLTDADKKHQMTEYALFASVLSALIKVVKAFEFGAVVFGVLLDCLGKLDNSFGDFACAPSLVFGPNLLAV